MNRQPNNVLFILPEYPPVFGGGIATFYGLLLPALVRSGINITVIVGSGCAKGPEPYVHEGVKVLPLDQRRAEELRTSFKDLDLTPDLVRHLAAAWAAWYQSDAGEGYDVVECTDWGLFFVPWLLKKSNPSLLVRLHGSEGQIALHETHRGFNQTNATVQFIEAALLPRAAARSTCSRSNQLFWASQTLQEVQYCPPPYAFAEQRQSSTRSMRGLVVGRIQNWKGPETLCAAVQLLGPTAPSIDWVGRSVPSIFGTGSFSDELKATYPSVWGSKVIPIHQEPPEAIAERQAEAAFVIVPSNWDVFNFTAIEAMARKCVVICSKGAGAADLIRHGQNGFLFESGNASQLAEQIHSVKELPPDARKAIGEAARQTIAEQLHPDVVARRVTQELMSAMSLANKVPSCPDLLYDCLSPVTPCVSSANAVFPSLERMDLKQLFRHVSARALRKIVNRVNL